MSDELAKALTEPGAWPFPVAEVEHLETHISHLFLVGPLAYKVKKAVDFGFLDFTTLERRRSFCEEEVRLNGRMAPGIYLGTVPVTRDAAGFHVEGEGEPVEYAVKMRRFDQAGLLDRHPLDDAILEALVERVAAFHRGLDAAPPESRFGRPEQVWFPVGQNFEQIRALGLFPELEGRLESLAGRARSLWERLEPLLAERKAEGFVRECHGDMHLGNIALVEGQVMVFDGIEFNEDFRWIDIVNDIAFLLMDLELRGHRRHAWRFLNGWLERLGDYRGAALIPFYKSYRAMVRAKVAALRLSQEGEDPALARALRKEFMDYFEYAEACLAPGGSPCLYLTHGPSGSGKSHFARRLREELGAIHLRSDLERKRLFGLEATQDSRSGLAGGIYTAEATGRTYRRLEALAGELLDAGYAVIVDATFLERARREPFRRLAGERQVPLRILSMQAAPELLRRRVARRLGEGKDPSEANLEVLERQLAQLEPLDAEEQALAVAVKSGEEPDWAALECG